MICSGHRALFASAPSPRGRTPKWSRSQVRARIQCVGHARYEGVACDAEFDLVCQHAWLLDTDDGRAVDLMSRNPGREYYGVAFNTPGPVSNRRSGSITTPAHTASAALSQNGSKLLQ